MALDAAQRHRLETFAALLGRWNARFNLVSRKDVDRLWPRHLLDSLSLSPFVGAAEVAIDLGTGAGLPGLPLAIAHPNVHWYLIDRNARKIRFLELAARELELTNVSPRVLDPAVAVPDALRGSADLVVSRAVAAPDLLVQLAEPLLGADARLVLMTGARVADAATAGDLPPEKWPLPDGFHELSREVVPVPGLDRTHEVTIIGRARRNPS